MKKREISNQMPKIVTVLGARPQFIKAAPLSKILSASVLKELIVHTGQHYDYVMSRTFFNELNIPPPFINLNIGSGSHAYQTGQMLIGIENVLVQEIPDVVLVYGDTNSTLAGALAAAKLHIPVAHIEAGLRSFNRQMPEEHNRVLTDHCADILFCPTTNAVQNLKNEGIVKNVFLVGDTMYDVLIENIKIAQEKSQILEKLSLRPRSFSLLTLHRPSNADDPAIFHGIIKSLLELEKTIVFPVHPRTQTTLRRCDIDLSGTRIKTIEPVGYIDMLVLEQNAEFILTDSGGVQKEAYMLGVPCITLRSETEWVETVETGWNILAGKKSLKRLIDCYRKPDKHPELFGNGRASQSIVEKLMQMIGFE